jgi:hypothetical protein
VAATVTRTEPSCEAKPGFYLLTLLLLLWSVLLLAHCSCDSNMA